MTTVDFMVVGAGIAGASIAAHLAETHTVLLCDMEDRAGYHSTGRSAASYEPNYGPPAMLALTRASHSFFVNPPTGFTEAPLFTPRGSLFFEAEGQTAHSTRLLAKSSALDEISIATAQSLFPPLRPDYAKRCFRDAHTADLDVDLIHRGFLKMFKARAGVMLLNSPLRTAERKQNQWHATCGTTKIIANTIVNAAGAWGDGVAKMCGVQPVGLQPKRRSVAVVPMPEGLEFQSLAHGHRCW